MSRVYRATFEASVSDGTLLRPSLHYQTDVPTAGSEPDPSDVAGEISAHLATAFRACIPTRDTLHALSVVEEVIPPDIGVAGSISVEGAGTLSGSGDSCPEGLVPLINLHTDVRSRSARGWMHLPSPHWSDYVSNNVWSGGLVTAVNSFCALLDDQLSIGSVIITDINPVVYSRTRHERAEDPFTFRVKTASLNTRCKWLKSRMSVP